MSKYQTQRRIDGSLAFLILASFIVTFVAARIFTTILPTVVVVSGGVHLHHFWYGLAMISVSGLLAIVANRPRFDRTYALIFGVGSGLIGDEIGLLLTLGNYYSQLTYFFFIGVLAFAGLGFLMLRYWTDLITEFVSLGPGRVIAEIGLVVAGLSVTLFAINRTTIGLGLLGIGAILAALGYEINHRRIRS